MTADNSTQRERLIAELADALDALELVRELVETAATKVRLAELALTACKAGG